MKDKVYLMQKFDAFLHTEGSKYKQSMLQMSGIGKCALTGCQKVAEGIVFRLEGG